nr:hypothetical protein 7 [Gammaproteobacteria bacterium]
MTTKYKTKTRQYRSQVLNMFWNDISLRKIAERMSVYQKMSKSTVDSLIGKEQKELKKSLKSYLSHHYDGTNALQVARAAANELDIPWQRVKYQVWKVLKVPTYDFPKHKPTDPSVNERLHQREAEGLPSVVINNLNHEELDEMERREKYQREALDNPELSPKSPTEREMKDMEFNLRVLRSGFDKDFLVAVAEVRRKFYDYLDKMLEEAKEGRVYDPGAGLTTGFIGELALQLERDAEDGVISYKDGDDGLPLMM